MIMPSDKEYTQTRRIMRGEKKMKPEFIPLAEWIDKTYGVKTINIIYDIIDKGPKSRLQICFEFEKEKQEFLDGSIAYYDKEKQKAIGAQFKKAMLDQGLAPGKYLTEDTWVIYGAFEPIAKMEATSAITPAEVQKLKEELNNKDIWEISVGFTTATYFLFTDKQVAEYNRPEVKELWAAKYLELVKPHDEFNYYKIETTEIYLDSKENFDNNYQSNWYYYYK